MSNEPIFIMKTFIIICIAGFLMSLTDCSTDLPKESEQKTLTTCKIVTEFPTYLHKEVRLKGKIVGYHQLIMYDDSCKEPRLSVYVWTSPEARKSFVDAAKSLDNQELEGGNFHFDATVIGTFETINYSDPSKKCYVPNDVISPEIRYCLSLSSTLEVRPL